jgi:hypothetical protein
MANQEREKFIAHDFNLPTYANELYKAEEVIDKLKIKLKHISVNKTITNKLHTQLFEEIIRVLDYVGQLSEPAFAIEDELEELYVLQYPHSPSLAKKLWLDHYEYVHHPYNILKNRCFRMLDEVDEEYIKKFKCKPPNWNI